MNLEKQLVVPKVVLGAVVVATKSKFLFLIYVLASCFALPLNAAILPEERLDLLYHSYDGGGVTIDGPSLLVRKNFNDRFSVTGNYYIDMVTSASIDVIRNGPSQYTEERTETSLGFDYLNDRTILSLNLTNSSENDYEADTIGFSISQEFFGDLSTLTMGYSLGDDTVMATGNPDFEEAAERRRFNLGFSQILTTRFILSLGYEAVIDEGFLNNPYRVIRYLDGGGTSEQAENYPSTRNSDSIALRGIFALNTQSSIRGEYRVFEDSWGVESSNIEMRYTRQFGSKWLVELRYRTYTQDKGADFYEDLFLIQPGPDDFAARDKELSQYNANQFGIGVTYTFKSKNAFLNNSTLNFYYDKMQFDYDDFRDVTASGSPGNESLYSLEADVIRLFYSAYF